jgi:alpha-L-fucosidase
MEFKKMVDESFKTNLAAKKSVSSSEVRGNDKAYAATNLTDGNFDTYWTTNDATHQGSFIVDLGQPTEINRVVLQEYIPLGQRVKSFSVEAWNGNSYERIDQQSTIGYKRILALPTRKASKIRVTILDANACPVIAECSVYRAPELLSNPEISRNKQGVVSLTTELADPVLRYTTDGSEPTMAAQAYTGPFELPKGGTVKAKAFIKNGKESTETIRASFDLAPAKWTVIGSTDNRAIDSNPRTVWQSNRPDAGKKYPHELVINLGEPLTISGFTYTPRQDYNQGGTIYQYSFYVSDDGTTWQPVLENSSFANIKNNPIKQEVPFQKARQARFIKLVAHSPVNETDTWASAAEVGVLVN